MTANSNRLSTAATTAPGMSLMEPKELKERLENTTFALRGYNVSNLGRTAEFLAHPKYGSIVHDCLRNASRVCADITKSQVDLVARVRRGEETTLDTYAEAVALIMAMEQAQLRLLAEFFRIEMAAAKYAMGYSLGEIAAVALSGIFDVLDAMVIPVSLAADCASLAADVQLGVLFTRGPTLPLDLVRRRCLEINQRGAGVIGISSLLSPNSLLLLGQADTLDRFKDSLDSFPDHTHLRKSSNRFPPMHTAIVWQRYIPSRAALLMQTLPGGMTAPKPQVLSLVTGKANYNCLNARDILHDWTDHPQLLWDAVYETLRADVNTIVHVGPEPNIMPATYTRLKDNVEVETRGSIHKRALSAAVDHPWIRRLLPERAALLRAPSVKQVILEDWLLEHVPA